MVEHVKVLAKNDSEFERVGASWRLSKRPAARNGTARTAWRGPEQARFEEVRCLRD